MKIPSFTINHTKLQEGIYVSRIDNVNANVLTTFDIRMKKPNNGDAMSTKSIHAIEHIGATYLRNHPKWKDKIIYFGPMGCRTGFYLIVKEMLLPKDILTVVTGMFNYIVNEVVIVPGATIEECGNYLDISLDEAKIDSKKYVEEVLNKMNDERMNYPK